MFKDKYMMINKLIEILCRERGDVPPDHLTERQQADYFRALCNIRQPLPVSDESGQAYAFPPETLLWPDSYLVLCQDKIKFKAVHPYVKNLLGDLPFGLSSEGESVRLLDAEDNVVDRVDYASTAPWPETADGTGYTIELIDVAGDNNRGENWLALTLFGTPGTGPE